MNRKQAIHYGNETMDIIKSGEYQVNGKSISILKELNDSIYRSILYTPDELSQLLEQDKEEGSHSTVIEVTKETTLEASKRMLDEGFTHVSALNFASAKNPGGGFLTGSRAQEESIARSSGLYPTIAQMSEMYEHNRKKRTGMYSDYMIFSPYVPVFRHDKGNLLENPYLVSFITSPAVNANVIRKYEKENVKQIEKVMTERMKKIVAVAKAQKQEVLVLGAFGCGVFGNNPCIIAKLFKEVIDNSLFNNYFKKIVFAIYEGTEEAPMFTTFKSIIQGQTENLLVD